MNSKGLVPFSVFSISTPQFSSLVHGIKIQPSTTAFAALGYLGLMGMIERSQKEEFIEYVATLK